MFILFISIKCTQVCKSPTTDRGVPSKCGSSKYTRNVQVHKDRPSTQGLIWNACQQSDPPPIYYEKVCKSSLYLDISFLSVIGHCI